MSHRSFTSSFLPEQELVNRLVARDTENDIKLNGNFTDATGMNR